MTPMESLKIFTTVFIALAFAGSSRAVCAEPASRANIVVASAWARATPTGAPTAAGYVHLINNGDSDDILVGASTPAAAKTELHSMSMANGIMAMEPVKDGVKLPAHSEIKMAPGGPYHIMFVGPKAPLKQGDRIPVRLHFAKAGDLSAQFVVEAIGAMAPASTKDSQPGMNPMDHMHMGGSN